jgi:hypothetical protein
MKCASAEIPKKRATAGPTSTLNIVTGAAKVDPGGPDIYVAFTGNEKSFASEMTAIICRRWKSPAMRLNRRRRDALNSFAIPTPSVELLLRLVDQCLNCWLEYFFNEATSAPDLDSGKEIFLSEITSA